MPRTHEHRLARRDPTGPRWVDRLSELLEALAWARLL